MQYVIEDLSAHFVKMKLKNAYTYPIILYVLNKYERRKKKKKSFF